MIWISVNRILFKHSNCTVKDYLIVWFRNYMYTCILLSIETLQTIVIWYILKGIGLYQCLWHNFFRTMRMKLWLGFMAVCNSWSTCTLIWTQESQWLLNSHYQNASCLYHSYIHCKCMYIKTSWRGILQWYSGNLVPMFGTYFDSWFLYKNITIRVHWNIKIQIHLFKEIIEIQLISNIWVIIKFCLV